MAKRSKKRHPWQDHYARKAKKDNYPARSVYKLEEMQSKYRLIKPGDSVVDLGCAPGSWLLYAANIVGPKGKVYGIDLKPVTIPLPSHVTVHTGDIADFIAGYDEDGSAALSFGTDFEILLSDMAPSTTGNKHVDSTRSEQLCQTALSIAAGSLAPGGSFVCKIFQGADFRAFVDQVRNHFAAHKILKPQSSRKGSKEIFIIGMGKREAVPASP